MKITPITKIKLEFMKIVLVHIFSQHLDEELNKSSKEKIKDSCIKLTRLIDEKLEEN